MMAGKLPRVTRRGSWTGMEGGKPPKSDPPVLSLAPKPVLHDKGKPTAGCLLHPKPVKRVVPCEDGLLWSLASQTFYECLGDRRHSLAPAGKPMVSHAW